MQSSLTGAIKGLKDPEGTQEIQEPQGPLLTSKGSAASASAAAAVLQLPLNQYIRQAVELQREQSEAHDPRSEKFQTPVFTLARFAKAHPAIAALSEDEAMQQVDVALYELAMCEPNYPTNGDPWEFFFPEAYPDEGDGDQARMDFAEAWAAVLTSPFDDPLSNALRLAEQRPFPPPRDRGLRYQKFVSIAAWLQAMMGDDGIILLPTHKLAPMLSCTPRNVTSLRRQAIRDGLLQEIKPHHFSSTPGESEATVFRFIGRWKEGQP